MAERMRCWKLETEDGDRDIVVMRTLMPWPISNRIMYTCLYHYECENGDFITCQSSRGNDFYYEKYRDQLGKDVVANHVISMTKMRDNEDGSADLAQVICVDPRGTIPDLAKKIVAKGQAMNAYHLIEYLKHGTIPPQM